MTSHGAFHKQDGGRTQGLRAGSKVRAQNRERGRSRWAVVKTGPREAFLRWGDLRVLEGENGRAQGEGGWQVLGRRDIGRAKDGPFWWEQEEEGLRGARKGEPALAQWSPSSLCSCLEREEEGRGRELCQDTLEDRGGLRLQLQLVGSAVGIRREERSGLTQ